MKRVKIMPRDDMPRFISFIVPLLNYDGAGLTKPPPMRRIALPYQVLPNGRILAAQLIKVDLHWSPCEGILNGSKTLAIASWLRRIVFDAVQQPYTFDGQAVPYDPNNTSGSGSNGLDSISSPLMVPSVIGCFDRVTAYHQATAGTPAGLTTSTQSESHIFGCDGDQPVIPSGGLYVYGFFISAGNGTFALHANDFGATLNTLSGFPEVFMRAPEARYNNAVGYHSDNLATLPYVTCRLWYRTVELTPFQHIMIVNKYTNKLGMSSDESYDKLMNTSTAINAATNPIYPNVPVNPLVSNGTNPPVWFGS